MKADVWFRCAIAHGLRNHFWILNRPILFQLTNKCRIILTWSLHWPCCQWCQTTWKQIRTKWVRRSCVHFQALFLKKLYWGELLRKRIFKLNEILSWPVVYIIYILIHELVEETRTYENHCSYDSSGENCSLFSLCWTCGDFGCRCSMAYLELMCLFVVFMALITSMVLCARSQDSSLSGSVRKVHVVFATAEFRSGRKQRQKALDTSALQRGIQ